MTAYGAVISLKNTIDYILHPSHFTLVEPSHDIIQLAYEKLQPLQEILERLDSSRKSKSRKKVNALDGRIKDKIWDFEDKLEFLLTHQILETDILIFSIDLQRLRDDVASFIHELKEMEMEYIYELENMAEDDDDDEKESICSKMIGLSDLFQTYKRSYMDLHSGKHVCALVGMAGVGKTTLANQIFRDPEILSFFECRVWVRIGRVPQELTQLSRGILAKLEITQGDEERWEQKKSLIVLDDVWEIEVFHSLVSFLPEIKNGLCLILVTARENNAVARISSDIRSLGYLMVPFLNEEESKELLCEKVFGGKDLCPDQLDKAATKIAKKCEGLPLMIVTVADILLKSQNREPEYWNEVAEERNSVFTDAYNEISTVLFPSYDYLPQYLKTLFLYLGVFPSDYDFSPSKIMTMLTAEGWFLDANEFKSSLEESVWQCLDELCLERHLVLFIIKSICWDDRLVQHRFLKLCRLHSSWRHLCRVEARKNKFYQVLNRLVDAEEECVKGQRGLCLENNLLFGIKEFCHSVRLNCASSTRSLLFLGPYHQYPTPINVGFRLLMKLDALQLRFYTFPTEILKLVQLKYLALTCNGEPPSTISKLFNLRVLIVHPHMKIRHYGIPSYVPIQIWDMKELEHIEILGKSLVAPYDHVASLEMLSILVGVNASISTILELSKRIPNIRKLGVQIELTPYNDHNDLLSCIGCISTLESLETLKCSIINPVVKSGYVVPVTPSPLLFPHGLKKLHLSGMGFPWEYVDVIGSLPFLQVLKLRSYAFRGSKWEAQDGSFLRLEFLVIEDSDLVQWIKGLGSFPELSYLSMKHCYKLEVIQWSFPCNSTGQKLELVDCNPLALTYAKQLRLDKYTRLDITATSHFDKKPRTIRLQRYGSSMTR